MYVAKSGDRLITVENLVNSINVNRSLIKSTNKLPTEG